MQSILRNFKLLKQHPSFRLDAEYYHPNAIGYENKIKTFQGKTIKQIGCTVVSGPFGSSLKSNAYLQSGIPFIRISDLRNFIISKDNLIFISELNNKRLASSQLNIGDLVLSKVGNTIGVVSKVTKNIGKCNISENNIGIKLANSLSKEIKDTILTYLNSKVGQSQIIRAISGNAQPKLNVSDIEDIIIPDFKIIKTLISTSVDKSILLLNKSKHFYTQAQTLLLSELGLLYWKPKHQLSFVKKFSDTQEAGRFDAEYFQPKYEEIVKAIKKYKDGWDILGNVLNVKDKNVTPKDKVKYKYIELANIISNGEITGFTEAEGQELPTRARRKVNKDDIIISSIEGSLSSTALITPEYDNALCSTGFYVVNSDKVNPETLLVLLKSSVGQLQLKKGCNGTILTAINQDELNQVALPIIEDRIQNQIQQKISKSFKLRKQSKQLLEAAKKAVEMAIEKSEEESEKWLKEELEEVNA